MDTDFTAAQAHSRAQDVGTGRTNAADSLNYNLTLKRLLSSIKMSAENGEQEMVFSVPWFVFDGTCTDQGLLTRQLKKRLEELGYFVRREGTVLYIDWDIGLRRKEEEMQRKRLAQIREEEAKEKKRLADIRRKAQFGNREVRKITTTDQYKVLTEPPKAQRDSKNPRRPNRVKLVRRTKAN